MTDLVRYVVQPDKPWQGLYWLAPLDDAAPQVICGTSDPEWDSFAELKGRHCIRPAGHAGFHIAQRDDETHQQTWDRCVERDA